MFRRRFRSRFRSRRRGTAGRRVRRSRMMHRGRLGTRL